MLSCLPPPSSLSDHRPRDFRFILLKKTSYLIFKMVTKVMKIVSDTCELISLMSIIDAYDQTPEDKVLNPLKAVVDAYDNAPEEDRRKIRVILVMGLTGTGKSTFIKKLTNDHNIAVGNDLHSGKYIASFYKKKKKKTILIQNTNT